MFRPEWGRRSCDACQKYLFNDDGTVVRRPARTGLPVLRPPGTLTPCHACPKVPDDAPAKSRAYAQELSPRNARAYRHYLECRAVGHFPDDPIVRRNARLIREVEDAADHLPLLKIAAVLENAIWRRR